MSTTKKRRELYAAHIILNLVVLLLSIFGLWHFISDVPADAAYVSGIALLGSYPYFVGIASSVSVLAFTYARADKSTEIQAFTMAGVVFLGFFVGSYLASGFTSKLQRATIHDTVYL